MKKEVLFVVDEQMYGGISTVLTAIMKKIDYEKYNVDLLILNNRGDSLTNGNLPTNVKIIYGNSFFSGIDLTISEALKTKRISTIFRKVQNVFYLKTGLIKSKLKKERSKILSKNYDVEIAFKDGYCVLFTAVGDSKKKISWLHVSYDICDCTKKYRKLFKNVYDKNIDEIVAITEDVKETFNKIYKQDNKVKIIENLIDTENIIQKSNEGEVEFDIDKINLICVGRIAYQKAYPRLFYQIAKLKREKLLNDVMFHIIGEGPEKKVLDQIILENGLEENIDFLGYQKNPYKYIKKADMLLLPSFFEGLGLVLIEANLLGVPAFATEFANVDKTLKNGEYGYIVANTESGIYEGLKYLLTNREKILKYKENLKKYNYEKNDYILNQITELLGN